MGNRQVMAVWLCTVLFWTLFVCVTFTPLGDQVVMYTYIGQVTGVLVFLGVVALIVGVLRRVLPAATSNTSPPKEEEGLDFLREWTPEEQAEWDAAEEQWENGHMGLDDPKCRDYDEFLFPSEEEYSSRG